MRGPRGNGAKGCHRFCIGRNACFRVLAWFFLVTVSPGWTGVTQAQTAVDVPVFSAGLLAGPTSGLGFKVLFQEPATGIRGTSVDLNVSFNGRGFLHVSGHSLREQALPDTPLRLFLGPGMVAELDDGTPRWGISAAIGGYFLRGPYEVLFELMPQLLVTPERQGSFGAAVGLRYRF